VESIGLPGTSPVAKCRYSNDLHLLYGQTDNPCFSTELASGLLAFFGPLVAIVVPNLLFLCGLSSAGVAQLVEHLICNQRVGGSIPSASSTIFRQGSEADRIPA
jgi:hypothetical protein